MASFTASARPWTVDETQFPKEGSRHEQIEFILRYAILAPSFYESQPWRFVIDDEAERINIYADPSRWLQAADPEKRELYVSLGCTLENILVAIEHFGLGHKSVAYMPEPGNDEWAARIEVDTARKTSVPRPEQLFSAINQSHAYVHRFEEEPLSREDLSKIVGFLDDFVYEDSTMTRRVYLDNCENEQQKQRLVQLISEYDATLFSNEEFRQELVDVIPAGQSLNPVYSEGFRSLNTDPVVAARIVGAIESTIISQAPFIGILCTNADDPTAAIKAGQAIERIVLQAKLCGAGVYPLLQLAGNPEMRMQLRYIFPNMEDYPQAVFAMGYVDGQTDRTTPYRIPLEQVMLHS